MILSKDLEKILSVITEMSKEENYYKLLEDILEVGMDISNCDGGTLYLLNGNKLEFFFMITKSLNIKDGGVGKKIDLPPVDINSPSVAALCAKSKRIINVKDVYSDKTFNWSGPMKYDELTGYHTESVLVLPLFDKEKNVLGVMQLINAVLFKKVVPFSYDVEQILYTLSSLSGILLDNMNLYNNTKELLGSFANILVKSIDNNDDKEIKEKISNTIIEFIDYLNYKEYDSISNNIKEEIALASKLLVENVSDDAKAKLNEIDFGKKYCHVKDIVIGYYSFINNNIIENEDINKYVNILAICNLSNKLDKKDFKKKLSEYNFINELADKFIEFLNN